jgi:predicted site-specific integrase-resolvase
MYVTPKKASEHFNVTDQALRKWANEGVIKYYTTKGGHRRYFIGDPNSLPNEPERRKIIYARVSSRKQERDLSRQIESLQNRFPDYEVITDIGSGINFRRKGFRTILEGLFLGTVSEVVVAHKDRFSRFGFELFEWIFQEHKAQLLSIEEENKSHEEELSEDIMAIITVFTSRYYGSRKYKVLQENKSLPS